MSDTRTRMLETLRQGLAAAPFGALPETAPVPGEWASSPLLPEDPWESFRFCLNRVRVALDVASDAAEAARLLLVAVDELGAKRIALWSKGLPEGLDVAGILAAAGREIAPMAAPGECCRGWADADLGITGVYAALSRSGGLVVRAGEGMPRSASLVPPRHLALVPKSALRGSSAALPVLLRELKAQGMPSAVHVITGPSSTSDIELTPVFGVHGPTTVRVIGLDYL